MCGFVLLPDRMACLGNSVNAENIDVTKNQRTS